MLSQSSILTSYFVLVVVRLDDRFLLIQERIHGQKWYAPAGRVEPEEHFVSAARRETLEEAGISVEIEGILRIEYSPQFYDTARLRVIFVAQPKDKNNPLKAEADEHSLQARWVKLSELNSFPLRGDEVREIFQYVADGGTIYPLKILSFEGAPFKKAI